MAAKLFADCIKDATAQSVHSVTALGNERRRQDEKDVDDDDIDPGSRTKKQFSLKIEKADPDQQLIFGWASVVERDGRLIIDKQGDQIAPEELEKAAYDYVLFSRDQGDMHRSVTVGKMVESMVFTGEKQRALGVNLGLVGWWVGFKVHDPEVWDAHKRGDRLELSIGGSAVPIEVA